MGTAKFNKTTSLSLNEAIKNLKEGDLFFSGGNSLTSEAIKKASNSSVSHVGIITFWHKRAMILESVSELGVKATPLEHYLGNYHNTHAKYDGKVFIGRHKKFPKDELSQNAFFDVAIDWLGVKYDIGEGIRYFLNRITKFIPRKENDIFVCSEYVEMCFRMININLPRHNSAGFIFPEDIAADPNVDILFEVLPNSVQKS